MNNKEQKTGEGLGITQFIMQYILASYGSEGVATRMTELASSCLLRIGTGENDKRRSQRSILYTIVPWINFLIIELITERINRVTSRYDHGVPALGKKSGFVHLVLLKASSSEIKAF